VPPVFDGERLIVYALGMPAGLSTARLSGTLSGRAVGFEVPIDPAAALAGDIVATLAARARIRALEEKGEYLESRGSRQRRARGKASNAAAEIAALGVKYQLCSRETSFVAIEHRDTPATERSELRRVPVALTSGWGGVGRRHRQTLLSSSLSFPLAIGQLAQEAGAPPQLCMEDADAVTECRSNLDISEPWTSLSAPPPPSSARVFYQASRVQESRWRRGHDILIALQSADGSWDLTQEFAEAVAAAFDVLVRALDGASGDVEAARRALATALALTWLETRAAPERGEWEMLAGKAWRWLAGCSAAPAGGVERWIDLAARLLA